MEHIHNDIPADFDFSKISANLQTTNLKTIEEHAKQAESRIPKEELLRRIEETLVGKYKGFRTVAHHCGRYRGYKAIIVGGGPSIEKTIPDIKRQLRLSKKIKVFALNKTHDYLIHKKGFEPGKDIHFGVMCDPADWVSSYQTPEKRMQYILASQLHGSTLDRFLPHAERTFIYHAEALGGNVLKDIINPKYPNQPKLWLNCGTTVGIGASYIVNDCDFDEVELHGFDSCYPKDGGQLHPYSKPATKPDLHDRTIRSKRTGKKFQYLANYDMSVQSYEFGEILRRRWNMPISVAGDGVIPWMAYVDGGDQFRHATPERMSHYDHSDYFDFRPEWWKNKLCHNATGVVAAA